MTEPSAPRVALYEHVVFFGLALLVWFGCWAHAAHDVWAATSVFATATALGFLFLLGRLRDGNSIRLPFIVPSLILLAVFWISFFGSFDRNSTLLEAWGWTFALLIFYLAVNVLINNERRFLFFRLAGLCLFPLAGACIWQQWTGTPDGWGHWEIHGSLINSVVLAGFALNWIFIFGFDLRRRAWLSGVLLLCCFLLLVLARSWWAPIAIIIGGFYLRWRDVRDFMRRHGRPTLVAAIFAGLALAAVVAHKLRTHQGPYVGNSRLFYGWSALRMWIHSPVTGVGLGGFATAYPFFREGHVQSTLFAHNFFLERLAETGILGGAAIVLWIWALCRNARKENGRDEQERVFPATLVAIAGFALLSINLEYLLNKIMVMLLAAAWVSHAPSGERKLRPMWLLVSAAVLVSAAPFWFSLFQGSRLYAAANLEAQRGSLKGAERLYRDATSVNPTLSESYARLAILSLQQGSSESMRAANAYLEKAWKNKKDPVYEAMLHRLNDARTPSVKD